MAWVNDEYIRKLLDGRERWGTLLSLTAVAAVLVFLSEHPHRNWVKLGPLVVGVFGSFYLLVVNCYYKQGEAIANESDEKEKARIKGKKWHAYASSVGILGWLHILAPIVVGVCATLTLYYGLLPAPADQRAQLTIEVFSHSANQELFAAG